MKLLVLCLIVIANVSYNGKASIESIDPGNTNILLTDTTKNADKSCYRPCKYNVKPRRCQYNFKIEPTVGDDGRPTLVINDMTPGPPIHVCVNDIVIVKVQNKVPGQDMAIHWHGVEQKGTPYMDGVPMVTQCPIGFGSTYEYAFIASSPGTFFYHADAVAHQSDGVYGSLIVDQPQPLEPHSSLYDFDRSKEHTLILAARFPEMLSGNLDGKQLKPDSLVINGEEKSMKIFVIPGYTYRLRLINAVAVECPLIVDIEHHNMIVIASDSKPVKPMSADKVMLYPGERMDVVVEAVHKSGGYWVNVRGGNECEGLTAHGMLLYSGFNYTSLLDQGPGGKTLNNDVPSIKQKIISGQRLLSLQEENLSKDVKSIYLAVDKHVIPFNDKDNDYRYLSDVTPKKNFYPAAVSLQDRGVVQINNKNFLYPNDPYLIKPRNVRPDTICNVGDEMMNKQLQCLQVLKIHDKKVVELVFINEGFGSNDSYTFHMHGYSMRVLATGQSKDGKPISKSEFQLLDKRGKIERNLRNPPIKDTFIVPNKGYTILRLNADRGGSWMLECRSCGFFSLPVAILIDVPITIPKSVVDVLPKCGSYKPADVLLN
ncbi:PREDICTED: laccase-2-like isoform X1 [Papilio xuthus]|uniref:Laccase-2-like isoform X1 n=1 Tax=Papilio xuthus TaxID=66420 RepID=A0AAJ7EK47_PAPXU|nr:PREDICTED: laccase-2-like isoform X1 [Papilio xuthus]